MCVCVCFDTLDVSTVNYVNKFDVNLVHGIAHLTITDNVREQTDPPQRLTGLSYHICIQSVFFSSQAAAQY